jgi:hypothetical protein
VKDHFYIVTVTCETLEEANQVIVERIGPEEDYGFEYSIDWQYSHSDTPIVYAVEDCSECQEELIWDPKEMMYYCPNAWVHG